MRVAVAIGGLLVAGGLGAYGAVEAQKYPITHDVLDGITSLIRSATAGPSTNKPTTTAAAPADVPAIQSQTPRTVVSDVSAQAPAQQTAAAPQTAEAPQAAPAAPVQLAARRTPQAAPPAPPAAPAAAAPASQSAPTPGLP